MHLFSFNRQSQQSHIKNNNNNNYYYYYYLFLLNCTRSTNKTLLILWCNTVHQQTNRTNKLIMLLAN